jgi:uncharacterized lipoprotein YajG
MRTIAVILAALAGLGGCAAPAPTITSVRVPVPVACAEPVPDRPAMPTESPAARNTATWTLDAHLARLHAEVDLREGYEIQLRAALEACTRPVESAAAIDPPD